MPLTSYGDQKFLEVLFGSVTGNVPATFNVGLIKAKGYWTASTVYTAGDIVVPTDFATTNSIFVCAVGGTSGSTQPTWSSTSLVSDTGGSAVRWVDVSAANVTGAPAGYGLTTPYFYTQANILSNEFASANGYSRKTATNNNSAGNFASPSLNTDNKSYKTTYGTGISFTQSTAAWGSTGNLVVGFFFSDSATVGAGNVWAWGTLSNYIAVASSGITVNLPATTGLTVTLA